jgi:hypothetical protein
MILLKEKSMALLGTTWYGVRDYPSGRSGSFHDVFKYL